MGCTDNILSINMSRIHLFLVYLSCISLLSCIFLWIDASKLMGYAGSKAINDFFYKLFRGESLGIYDIPSNDGSKSVEYTNQQGSFTIHIRPVKCNSLLLPCKSRSNSKPLIHTLIWDVVARISDSKSDTSRPSLLLSSHFDTPTRKLVIPYKVINLPSLALWLPIKGVGQMDKQSSFLTPMTHSTFHRSHMFLRCILQ
jgi:hypothetical protein